MRLVREKNSYDCLRVYEVIGDNKLLAKIKQDSSIEVDVSQVDKLWLKIDWCTSNVIEISEIDQNNSVFIVFNTASKKGFFAMLYQFWFMIITRNKYLTIKEI